MAGKSFWSKVKKHGKAAGYKVLEKGTTLYYTFNAPDTPKWAKGVIGSALAYFISPVDAIPDVVPVAGYSDDLGVLVLAVYAVARCIVQEHRDKAKNRLNELLPFERNCNEES